LLFTAVRCNSSEESLLWKEGIIAHADFDFAQDRRDVTPMLLVPQNLN